VFGRVLTLLQFLMTGSVSRA